MKCPKCKQQLELGDFLYAKQKYVTDTTVQIDPKTKKIIDDDLCGGYNDLIEFIDNMLIKEGKPKILGCSCCM